MLGGEDGLLGGHRRQADVERLRLLHELEHLVLERGLSALERLEIGLEGLSFLGRGDGPAVELSVDGGDLGGQAADLVFESALASSQLGPLVTQRLGTLQELPAGARTRSSRQGSLGDGAVAMLQLIECGVVLLQVEQPLESGHGDSIAHLREWRERGPGRPRRRAERGGAVVVGDVDGVRDPEPELELEREVLPFIGPLITPTPLRS